MQTWTNRKHIRRIDHALPRWDWQDPIDEWMRWQLAVGRSKETLRTRWYQLERFSRITDKPIHDVTADDVIGYFILAEERESGTSLSTKRGVRTSLNAFYKWCIKRGIAERNPIDDVPVIPLGVPAGLICPEHAIDEAIKSEDDMTVDMVMLGAWMGLRRIEIASIDLAQDIEDNPDEELRRGGLPDTFRYPCHTSAGTVWCDWDNTENRTGIMLRPVETGSVSEQTGWLNRQKDRDGLRWWWWETMDGRTGERFPSYQQALLDFIDHVE